MGKPREDTSVSRGLRGQAMLIAVVLFLAGALIVIGGIAAPVLASLKDARTVKTSKQSFYTSEAALEDAVYRLREGLPISETEILELAGSVATVTVTAVLDQREVSSVGDHSDFIRATHVTLQVGSGAAFHYGLQADNGGVVLENSSSIRGNVYSNGSVRGYNSNIVRGSVVSAGPSGLIDGVHATSSAYARTIRNSNIEGDVYYQTISNTMVGGTSYPGSADQPTSTLPIPDAMIETWKADAAAGGVISSPCPYKISSGTVTLGPKKINCDFEVSNIATIILEGPLWVSGNIDFKNSVTIQVSPTLSGKTVPIIADKETNRLTSSKIIAQNSSEFEGSGSDSYILLVSKNRSAKDGGSEIAIDLKNSSHGAVLTYAADGEIVIQNSISIKEVAAYRVRAKNSAEIVYQSGLANLLFVSGPSGGFSIIDWLEEK